MKDCIQSGVTQGFLSQAEGMDLAKAWDNFLRDTGSPTQARALVLELVNAELDKRKAIALLMEERRKAIISDVQGFRDARGEADPALAWRMMHDRMGHEGLFPSNDKDPLSGMSAFDLEQAIVADVVMRTEAAVHAFKGGFFSGDTRRTSAKVAGVSKKARIAQARMSEVVRAMRGEKTDDATAKALADILMENSEYLRLRFNAAGGSIGKLDKRGPPQMHNPEALLKFGRDSWVNHMMGEGVLDRERMTHPLTDKPYTDTQLRETLTYIWDKVTTDGYADKEITGAPTGRGAIWKQHADHRVLHFKSTDAWMKYAKQFGNPDPIAAIYAEYRTMARDIAHMEKFGPNPVAMRTYMREWIMQQAHTVRPVATIIAEQTARMKALASQMTTPNPDYEAIADRIGVIHGELAAIRRKHTPQLGGRPSRWNRARIEALDKELLDLEGKLTPYLNGEKEQTIQDLAVAKQLQDLAADMRDPVVFVHTDNPAEYADSSLRFTDDIWTLLRGSGTAPLVVRVSGAWPGGFAGGFLGGVAGIPLGPAGVMAGAAIGAGAGAAAAGRFGWRPNVTTGFDVARNMITASSLRQAILSAVTDPAFGAVRRGFVGMGMDKANPASVMLQTFKAMASEMTKRDAARAGIVADSTIRGWQSDARYNGAIDMRGWSGFIASTVINVQGLAAFTRAGKNAFGGDFMGMMAEMSGTRWTALPDDVRQLLMRGGFDSGMWDRMRAVPLHEPKPGATFMRPRELYAVHPDLAQRYTAMILRETRYAVPESTPTAQAIMRGGTTAGTAGGILARSFSQFKSFGFSVAMLHLGQIAAELHAGKRQSAAAYAGLLLIYGTLLGTLAMALKDVNAGRDPRKMFDDETLLDLNFWGAALLQAGGLGIYGDFLFSNLNRFGGSLPGTVAGPIWGRLDNIKNLTFGNLAEVMQGKDTKFGKELSVFIRQNMPNVVWTSLVWERVVMDQVQTLMDPNAREAFRRDMNNRGREYGQSFWWERGSMTPSRAPDVSRVFATR